MNFVKKDFLKLALWPLEEEVELEQLVNNKLKKKIKKKKNLKLKKNPKTWIWVVFSIDLTNYHLMYLQSFSICLSFFLKILFESSSKDS